jgi:hypothetical protein
MVMTKRAPILSRSETKTIETPQVVISKRRPDQIGKRMISAMYPEPVYKQFRLLAAEKGVTSNALLAEALNDLFHKYGKDSIA